MHSTFAPSFAASLTAADISIAVIFLSLMPTATLLRQEYRYAYKPAHVVEDAFPDACKLLAYFGYRAIRPSAAWFSSTRGHKHAARPDDPLADDNERHHAALRLTRQCGVDGSNRTHTHVEPLIVMWLGEATE